MFKNLVLLLPFATLVSAAQITDTLVGPATLAEAVTWLESESHRLIRVSKRTMKDGTAAFPPQVGIGYEAFWLRNFTYTLEGSISSYTKKELREACKIFICGIRADGAGVDCVKFDGHPIYKPGFGTMSANPVADGSQFIIAVAWHTYLKTKDLEFLGEIIDALIKTMNAVPRNPETRLVHIKDYEWDRCPYGFTDTVRENGACEWVFGEKYRLPNYLASASLPLAGIRAMIERRKTDTSFGILGDSND